MKAKLLRNAGRIRKGAEVEIVSKVPTATDERGAGAAGAAASPVYAVKDGARHEETVNTNDLKPTS